MGNDILELHQQFFLVCDYDHLSHDVLSQWSGLFKEHINGVQNLDLPFEVCE